MYRTSAEATELLRKIIGDGFLNETNAAAGAELFQRKEVDSAVAAIKFALETDEGLPFLRLWMYGEFDKIRAEWPDAPLDVFIGADPTLRKNKQA